MRGTALLLVVIAVAGIVAAVGPSSRDAPASLAASLPAMDASPPLTFATPAAGLTLTAPAVTAAAVSLSWNEATVTTTGLCPQSFDNYTVAYSLQGAGGPFLPAPNSPVITAQTTTQYATDSLSPGTSYWWQVTAYISNSTNILLGCGGGVETQSSNVLSVAQAPLAYLTNWTTSTTSMQLNWTDQETYGGLVQLQYFELFQKNSSAQPFAPVVKLTNNATRSYDITGLTAGASYEFYLNTSDCVGSGCASISATSSNSVTVGVPFALSVSVSAARPDLDVGETDLLSCNAAGGTAPYAYYWSINGSAFVRGNSTRVTSFASGGAKTATCQVNATSPPGGVRATTGHFV